MIEPIMYFGIGFLVAALLGLLYSRVMSCSFLPQKRAGSRKRGSKMRAASVICQQSTNIAPTTRTTVTMLPTTSERMSVNALCAPRDVGVQSTDQGSCLRAREEGERHLLDVLKELGAQDEYDASAHCGGQIGLRHT